MEQSITNGFGQTIVQAQPNTLGGFIYSRSEYNDKGELTRQYQDTGFGTAPTASTLYEYDAFGNRVKQTLALCDAPTPLNSPVIEMSYGVETAEDGVYSVATQTRYNAEGNPIPTTQKQLLSQLSATLASKSISVDARGNSTVQWAEHTAPAKVTSCSTIPVSAYTAQRVSVDGFTTETVDHAGITGSATRHFTETGMVLTQTDGRGNTTTTVTDIAGRTVSVTDAAGNTTSTDYCACCDNPAVVTDAMGNTSCYKYDLRGRKIAEWGTAQQPACFAYDDMDNMTSLRTFRADGEVIATNPSERSDYDETIWTFNAVTGLEISKTFADDTSVLKTYDIYNRLATETDARGNVKTHTYEHARGLHLGTTYTVVDGTAATTNRSFTYNHLGQQTQLVDDAGTRCFGYNSYGERETDSLVVDGDTHLITEQRDSFGRSTGYTYAKNGTVQQTITTEYGDDGRIASAGFSHGGEQKLFSYTYLAGSNLLQVLTKPNGMTLTQTYESTRDLLTRMSYHRGSTLVAQREYTYDILGRPTARNTARQGSVVNDTFAHNSRSELVEAQVNGKTYEYAYDNIGNRLSSVEDNETVMYDTNMLNQYTTIAENGVSVFEPLFDADGNQTLIKTNNGIWAAVYNAENRPVSFMNVDKDTVVECSYDSMGRRAYKKVTSNGSVTLHQRYIYRGYQQIACIDLTRTAHPALWYITWDPTQVVATRPLALQINGTWYAYGWDLTKNICELFSSAGYISNTYTYTPFGKATESGVVTQPIQWSSEVMDSESSTVYYNWRFYCMYTGRWINRDYILTGIHNLYDFVKNKTIQSSDSLGLFVYGIDGTNYNVKKHGTKPGEKPDKDDQISYVYDFVQLVQEGNEYIAGPGSDWTGTFALSDMTGSTFPGFDESYGRILWRTYGKICERKRLYPGENISIVGWSRGAILAVHVAELIKNRGCCTCWKRKNIRLPFTSKYRCEKYSKDEATTRINFLGLFDPVDRVFFHSTPEKIPDNVASAHIITKSIHDGVWQGFILQTKDYPTGGNITINANLPNVNGQPTNHGEIGGAERDYYNEALRKMVKQARNAGVNVKNPPNGAN